MLDNKGHLLMLMVSKCLSYSFNRIFIKKLIKKKKIISDQDLKNV